MGEIDSVMVDLVQLARVAVTTNSSDIRLFIAKLVRKYRIDNPNASEELNTLLKARPEARSTMLRSSPNEEINNDTYSKNEIFPIGLLSEYISNEPIESPLLSEKIALELKNLLNERKSSFQLKEAGLKPSSSVFFTGKPGVGKTLTAKWLAQSMNVPLYVLDLAHVMSSLLGQTGTNIKKILSYARSTPCVLLLDEIDAIAKKRNDDLDVGEMKRIVAVILQEVDSWDSESLLIAATNHPELIDHALWRRFDNVIEFTSPDEHMIKESIPRFLGNDYPRFEKYVPILSIMFRGLSYSDIEKSLMKIRRAIVIGDTSAANIIKSLVLSGVIDKKDRIELAKALMDTGDYSQHAIHDLIGVSRDTLRKYATHC